jgi:hypothetical protein
MNNFYVDFNATVRIFLAAEDQDSVVKKAEELCDEFDADLTIGRYDAVVFVHEGGAATVTNIDTGEEEDLI